MAKEISELERKLIRQVEYYFSDQNLWRDQYMQKLMKEDEGWIPVSTLMTFKRLSELSNDAKVILDAVEKSDENLVQISEDREKMRRHPERILPHRNEAVRREVACRSALVKGFPLTTEMGQLIDFFLNYKKVGHIIMRKYNDKETKEYKFKGSVFATFDTKEQLDDFLKLESVKYDGVELERMQQQAYHDKKREQRAADQENKRKNEVDSRLEASIKLPKGAVLHMTGFGDETTREIIREHLPIEGDATRAISFIEFNRGDKEAYVRMREENAAKELIKKLEDCKITIQEQEVTVRVLEGDEEKEYLDKQFDIIKSHRAQQHQKKSSKRSKYRQNKVNKTKKRKNEDENGESHKKLKEDDGGVEKEKVAAATEIQE